MAEGRRLIGVQAEAADRGNLAPQRLAVMAERVDEGHLVRPEEVLEPATGQKPAQVAHEPGAGLAGLDYDPEEWLPKAGAIRHNTDGGASPTRTGLVRRCQRGRFESWHEAKAGWRRVQCDEPAERGSDRCARHGGVAMAKQMLADNAVDMMTELLRIALDPDEKTADKLAAINSGLDRAGGLGRTVAQPEPEVRSALMARLEAAYEQVVAAQEAGSLDGPPAAGVVEGSVQGEVVAAQELGPGSTGAPSTPAADPMEDTSTVLADPMATPPASAE